MKSLILRLALVLVMVAILLPASAAMGATRSRVVPKTAPALTVNTGAAARAQNDIKLRRLKNLFVGDKVDAESYFARVQELRRSEATIRP